MQLAISLLVSTVIFSASIVTTTATEQAGTTFQGNQNLEVASGKTPKRPGRTPHRGSGRRQLMEFNNYYSV